VRNSDFDGAEFGQLNVAQMKLARYTQSAACTGWCAMNGCIPVIWTVRIQHVEDSGSVVSKEIGIVYRRHAICLVYVRVVKFLFPF